MMLCVDLSDDVERALRPSRGGWTSVPRQDAPDHGRESVDDDKCGSIPTQIDECRATAQREGWTVSSRAAAEGSYES